MTIVPAELAAAAGVTGAATTTGAAAGVKHLYLIVNPRMLEINENSSKQPLQHRFIPLKELKEFTLIEDGLDEN